MLPSDLNRLVADATAGPWLVVPYGEVWAIETVKGKRIAVVRKQADAELLGEALNLIVLVYDLRAEIDGAPDVTVMIEALEAEIKTQRTLNSEVAQTLRGLADRL